MFFLQACEAPVEVQLGEMVLTVRKYTLKDAVAWGQQLHEQSLADQTKEMDEVKKREFMLYYRPVSPDLQALKAELRTPAGITQVLRTCLPKAKVTNAKGESLPPLTLDQLQRAIDINGTGRLSGLAHVLADLNEQSITQPPEEKGIDPLFCIGKPNFKGSPETGSTTSVPFIEPTHQSIPSIVP